MRKRISKAYFPKKLKKISCQIFQVKLISIRSVISRRELFWLSPKMNRKKFKQLRRSNARVIDLVRAILIVSLLIMIFPKLSMRSSRKRL